MYIISKTPNSSGAYPPLQLWQGKPPASHYLYPESLFGVFYPADKRCAGFVHLTAEGNTVTAAEWNEEAYQDYCNEYPESEPKPTQNDIIEAQVVYTAMCTDTIIMEV